MSRVLVDKLIEELSPETGIQLCGIGEPSLHPQFIEILGLLSKKFEKIQLVTNGALFRYPSLMNAVLASKVDKINFSLDYLDKEKFKEVKGGDLPSILDGFQEFIRLRKKVQRPPFIQISYLYEEGKTDYLEALKFLRGFMKDPWEMYVRRMKNLACQVKVSSSDQDPFFEALQGTKEKNLGVENWDAFLQHVGFKEGDQKTCRHIYYYYMLLWNGDVVPCCVDFNGTMVLHNVISEDLNLASFFSSTGHRKFRESLEEGDLQKYPLCAHCDDYFKYATPSFLRPK